MFTSVSNVPMTLSIATLFAAIFLFGGRLAYRPGKRGRRRFLSFAAGISVAYAFVHVLPALHGMTDRAMVSSGEFPRIFPEYSVYLWTMVGFLVFYGLETMKPSHQRSGEFPHTGESAATTWQASIHIGGFAVYAWLLTYLLVWAEKITLALILYAVAMGMHILPIACGLSEHYHNVYKRLGASILALACLAGWGCGLFFELPVQHLVNLVALVAGGVIVNTAIAELPKEQEGRYWSFLAGATVYTALLLALSHFEEGGGA